MLLLDSPLDLIARGAPLRIGGMRAEYDFGWSDTLDLSGNGFNLTSTGTPGKVVAGGRRAKAFRGSTDDAGIIGTSLIADTDHAMVVAAVYVGRNSSVIALNRGQDGFGLGWSIQFTVNVNGVSASCVVTSPSTTGRTATVSGLPAVTPGWVVAGMLVQTTSGVDPSHVSALCGGKITRTSLSGYSVLRSSTVGSRIGAGGADTAQGATPSALGYLGVQLINGYTEAQALARIRSVMRLVEDAFAPVRIAIPTAAAAAGGSFQAAWARNRNTVIGSGVIR